MLIPKCLNLKNRKLISRFLPRMTCSERQTRGERTGYPNLRSRQRDKSRIKLMPLLWRGRQRSRTRSRPSRYKSAGTSSMMSGITTSTQKANLSKDGSLLMASGITSIPRRVHARRTSGLPITANLITCKVEAPWP